MADTRPPRRDAEATGRRLRRPTATSAYGVGRRESHDASEFYRRFAAPALSGDEAVCPPAARRGLDRLFVGDIRDHPDALAPASVGLVVTSPPYYSGKEYETAIGQGAVPASYHDYLAMVTGVLGACVEALEPGGRMAVNVANLGRKPYRSLSADVLRIMEEDLGLLLRGEIIWRKARGAAGNCAWGTYQHPGDPVLRDLTERVVVASKGRFSRAVPPAARAARGLPSTATVGRDEFLEATVDIWELAPESARRVGHPAPFPVALPQRLIELYTYEGDLVVDPFMGSGTTAVAAVRTRRHFAGFDTDPGYLEAAAARVAAAEADAGAGRVAHAVLPAPGTPVAAPAGETIAARAQREGRRAHELARALLDAAGYTVTAAPARPAPGVQTTFGARDGAGGEWLVEVVGTWSAGDAGLRRPEALWRTVGKGALAAGAAGHEGLIVLTTERPPPRSGIERALAAVVGPPPAPVRAVVGLLDPDAPGTLAALRGRRAPAPPG